MPESLALYSAIISVQARLTPEVSRTAKRFRLHRIVMPRREEPEMPCYVTTNKPASREDYKLWCGMGYTGSYRDYEAVKKTHEGARIFMCGDDLELQNCADCTHVADYLCDYPVGEGKTCDRAMCDTHAHEIGPNLHYCDSHHAEWQRFVEAGGVSEHLKNVTAFKGA